MENNQQQSESHTIDIITSEPGRQTTPRSPMDVKLLNALMKDNVNELKEILINDLEQAQPAPNQVQAPQGEDNQAEPHQDEQGRAPHGELNQALPQQAPAPWTSRLLQGVTSDGDGVLHIVARFELVNIGNEICGSWGDAMDVAMENKRGESPLHCAAATGNDDIIGKLILLSGGNNKKRQLLRMKKHNGETCLHDAVRCGQLDAVKKLVDADMTVVLEPNDDHALVRIHDNEGVSPLYLATTLRQLEIVKFLADKQERAGVQYPAASYYGPGSKTALHAAVFLSKELSKHLAEWNKELIEMADDSGSTPLHLLASTMYKSFNSYSRGDLAECKDTLVLAFSSSVEKRDFLRPRFFLRTMDTAIMILLLKIDESAGYRADNEGSLPIHVAAASGNLAVVKLLSLCRPNCSWSCDNLGKTILHIAVEKRNINVVHYVCLGKKFERIFNTRDTDGNTALHLAVLQGDQLIFCKLMQREEICLSFTNKEERTPLDLAQLSLPRGISCLMGPQHWIRNDLIIAGADYGTCRSDHLVTNVAKPDKEKESESISKTAALLGVCAVVILTTAFGTPFSVTKFYDKTESHRARRVAYSIFTMSDALAFALSVVSISCSTLSGVSFMNPGTRLLYLRAGSTFLFSAAMFIILVFTSGVYLVLGPVVDNKLTVILVCLPAVVFPVILVMSVGPATGLNFHRWSLVQRLGKEGYNIARIDRRYRPHKFTLDDMAAIYVAVFIIGACAYFVFSVLLSTKSIKH